MGDKGIAEQKWVAPLNKPTDICKQAIFLKIITTKDSRMHVTHWQAGISACCNGTGLRRFFKKTAQKKSDLIFPNTQFTTSFPNLVMARQTKV